MVLSPFDPADGELPTPFQDSLAVQPGGGGGGGDGGGGVGGGGVGGGSGSSADFTAAETSSPESISRQRTDNAAETLTITGSPGRIRQRCGYVKFTGGIASGVAGSGLLVGVGSPSRGRSVACRKNGKI